MAVKQWNGNSQNTAQVNNFVVTGITTTGTTIGIVDGSAHTLAYVSVSGDTNTTAAANLSAMTTSTNAPAEFSDAQWSASGNTITAVATTPGTPYTFTAAYSGVGTLALSVVQPNVSTNDVNDPRNWSGATLPVTGDSVVLADTSESLLWNLNSLSSVLAVAVTQYNTFTGNVGLTLNNPAGYVEYRPQYFQIGRGANTLAMQLGVGTSGQGSGFQQYDTGAAKVTGTVFTTGSQTTDSPYALRVLGTNPTSTWTVNGGSVGFCMYPSETGAAATVAVISPAVADFGAGMTIATQLAVTNTTASISNVPPSVVVTGGAVSLFGNSSYSLVTGQASPGQQGAQIAYFSTAPIGTLTLTQSSVFDCSLDDRSRTIASSTIDGSSQILDPLNTCTFTTATVVRGPVSTGPIVFGVGRTVKIS